MPGGTVILGPRELNPPFRLAGATARVPAPGAAVDAFRAAEADGADLVLLTPECAAGLPPELLAAARRKGRPLVLVLPGPGASRFDIRPQIRRALGLEA
jgi:vacuolar-type H+-ATPase subunit F/Vma7